MNLYKGYYSVIQYCPDRSRLEAANIGVVLFCPELHFLKARTDEASSRIKRFFGLKDEEKWRIDALRTSIEERLKREREHFQKLENLEQFITTRANYIQITAPRPMKVSDPEIELEMLFKQLVEVPAKKRRSKETGSIRRVLSKAFEDENLKPKIKKNIKIELPEFRTVTAPFGYQNGHFNLIQPVRFEGKGEEATFKEACLYAIEGEYLSEYHDPNLGDLQLTVVGQFGPEQEETKETVSRILTERDVSLYTESNLDDLLDDIREHGKVLTATAS